MQPEIDPPIESVSASQLFAWRTRHGLSQQHVSTLLGVSVPTYRLWESGERPISPKGLALMQQAVDRVGPLVKQPKLLDAADLANFGFAICTSMDRLMAEVSAFRTDYTDLARGGGITTAFRLQRPRFGVKDYGQVVGLGSALGVSIALGLGVGGWLVRLAGI